MYLLTSPDLSATSNVSLSWVKQNDEARLGSALHNIQRCSIMKIITIIVLMVNTITYSRTSK